MKYNEYNNDHDLISSISVSNNIECDGLCCMSVDFYDNKIEYYLWLNGGLYWDDIGMYEIVLWFELSESVFIELPFSLDKRGMLMKDGLKLGIIKVNRI